MVRINEFHHNRMTMNTFSYRFIGFDAMQFPDLVRYSDHKNNRSILYPKSLAEL